MKKLYFLLLNALLLSSLSALAQETSCDNGIDDDADGYVDCFDTDCSGNTACEDFFMGDEASCEALPTEFPTFAMTLAGVSENETAATLSRPSIGDLDSDGIPEIVVTNRLGQTMHILSGQATPSAIAGQPGTLKTIQRINLGYEVESDVAIGDIDRDGRGELFVSGRNKIIQAYRYNAASSRYEVLWEANTNSKGRPVVLGLADFNEDGKSELYYKDEIRDAETGTILVNGSNDWERNIAFAPVAVDILPDNACTDCQGLELVAGGTIYSVNLNNGARTKVMSIPNYSVKVFVDAENWSSTSVADYNQDGYLDVIASGALGSRTGNTTVFFWDVHNDTTEWHSPHNNWERGTGRLNISDIDGNGKLNVTFVSGNILFALDEKFQVLWEKTILEKSSAFTGTSVFDFNGDGAFEIVYRDEAQLFIINGKDGSTYNAGAPIICVSRTSSEYPIVVDVDGDGATEICVTCSTDNNSGNSWNSSEYGQVRIFKSKGESWVPSRKVWNQHTYFNVNVNDDLTIPREMQKHHIAFGSGDCDGNGGVNRPLNTFLNQSPYLDISGCPTYGAPDFTIVDNSLEVHEPVCPDKNFTISFEIRNDGDIPVSGDVPVTFYVGDPLDPSSVKLNTVYTEVRNLEPEETISVDSLQVTGTGAAFTLYVSFNDLGTQNPAVNFPNGSIMECEYGGNIASAAVDPLPFKLGTLKIKDHLSCDYIGGDDVAGNGAARAFVLKEGDTLTAGYTFYWYSGTDLTTPVDTGAVVNSLPADTYTIRAVHDEALCSSTVQDELTIAQTTLDYQLGIEIIDGNRMCKNPQSPGMYDGELRAFIYEVNTSGDTVEITNPDFSFEWYPSRTSIGNPDSMIYSTAQAKKLKTQTYYVLFQDNNNGCTLTSSETVPDYSAQLTLEKESIQHITRCDQLTAGSIKVKVSGATDYKITWYKSNGDKINGQTSTTLSGRPAGVYFVEAVQNDTKCSSGKIQFEIENQTSYPQANATLTHNTACEDSKANGTITLNPTATRGTEPAAYTINWYKGPAVGGEAVPASKYATTNGYSLKNLTKGSYTARITHPVSRCSIDTTIIIDTQIQRPELYLSKSTGNAVCSETEQVSFNGKLEIILQLNGSAVHADSLKYFDITWKNPSGSVINGEKGLVLDSLAAGNYTATVKDNRTGCTIQSPASFNVADESIRPTLKLTPTHATSCDAPHNGKIEAAAALNGTQLSSGFTLSWKDAAGNSLPSDQISGTTASRLAPGTYKVSVTHTATNCTTEEEVEILNHSQAPVLSVASKKNNTICDPALMNPTAGDYNGAINLALSYDGTPVTFPAGDYSFKWFKDGSTTALPSYTGPSATNLSGGKYVIVVENTILHCKDTIDVSIQNRKPVIGSAISVTEQTSCDASTPNGELSAQMKDADGNNLNNNDFRFSWTNTGGTVVGTSSTATGLAAGTYTLTAVSNLTGCSYTFSKTVNDNKIIPVVTLSATQIAGCNTPGKIEASVNVGAVGDYTFEWYDKDGNLLSETDHDLNTWAGTFSVIAVHKTSKCRSQEKEATIDAPATGDFFNINLSVLTKPASCATNDGKVQAEVVESDGTTNTSSYTFTWYSGRATNYPATYHTSPQASFDSAPLSTVSAATETLHTIPTGTYTVVATHKTTGCTEMKEVHVPYVDAHIVETLGTTDETECSPSTPNGSFHLRIDPSTIPVNPATSLPYEQDIYRYFVYRGTNITTTSTVINGPDADGDGKLDGELGVVDPGGPNEGLVMDGLTPGFYTIKAIETISGNDCPYASVVIEIKQLSKPPVVDLHTVTANSFCDNPTDANGGITFTFGPASGDAVSTSYNYKVLREDGTTIATNDDGTTPLTGSNLPAGTVSLGDMKHGKYILQVSGAATSCLKEVPFEILQQPVMPELFVEDITVTPQTHCNPNGSITVDAVTFGTETYSAANYTFSWTHNGSSVGGNSPTLSAIDSGVYVVTITRIPATPGQYCSISKEIVVDYEENSFTAAFTMNPHTNCGTSNPNGSLSANVGVFSEVDGSRNISGSNFKWTRESDGAVVLQGADQNQIVSQLPGWYTLEFTEITTGCTFTDRYEILDRPIKPVVENLVVENQTTCNPNGKIAVESIQFNGTIFNNPDLNNPAAWTDYTFTWYRNGSLISGETGSSISGLEEAQYSVKVQKTGTPGQSCESSAKSAFVKFEDPQLMLTLISQPNDSCEPTAANGKITASASYGNSNISSTNFSFSWVLVDGTDNLTADNPANTPADLHLFNNEKAGTYEITVTDNTTGCTVSKTITIDDNLQDVYVTDFLVQNQDICNPSGSIQVLDVSPAELSDYTFYWYGEGYNDSNPDASFLATGTTLDISNYPDMKAGTYYVIAVRADNATPGAGCRSIARRITVEDESTPPAITLERFENVTSCVENNGVLEVSVNWMDPAHAGNSLEWYLNGSTSTYSTSGTIENLGVGSYTVKVTDGFSGCESTRTFDIEEMQVIPALYASATNVTYCSEDNGTLFASVSPIQGSSRSFTFHWYEGSHSSQPSVADTIATTRSGETLNGMPTGVYTVFAVENGGMGCTTAPAMAEITDGTQLPQPVALMDSPNTNCDSTRPNGQASVSVGGNITDYNFRWYRGGVVDEASFITSDILATKLPAGTYTVQATHKRSLCQGITQVDIIDAPETIVLNESDVQLRHRTNCAEGNGWMTASVQGETGGYEFFWFYGAQVDPARQISENGPSITGLEAGEYTVYARKTSTGCISLPVTKTIEEQFSYPEFTVETTAATCGEANGTASLTILNGNVASIEWYTDSEVIRNAYDVPLPAGTYSISVTNTDGCVTTQTFTVPVDIKVFNGITQNNDGHNDFFAIDCIENFPSNHVRIFNRAGTMVYETRGYNNADKLFDGYGNRGVYLQGNKLPAGTYFYVIDKKDGSEPSSGYLEIIR